MPHISRLTLAAALVLCTLPRVPAEDQLTSLSIRASVTELADQALALRDRPALPFKEIWAYLMTGEERFLPVVSPITDLAYFSARISSTGELTGVPSPSRLKVSPARKHLVVAEVSNQALLHFVLNPDYRLRNKLIQDIAKAAEPYDGVNIDFENMRSGDGTNFLSFLKDLKKSLKGKMLSVCVPARTKKLADAYDYAKLAEVCDRVFVMAYDEHWSGSMAGAVSSIGWSAKVARWGVESVGAEKLIMGMPFYGRAWGDKNPAGAYKHSSAARIVEERGLLPERNHEGIPYFTFSETVNAVLYYDDAYSTWLRGQAHTAAGVDKIGFWRLGQEDPDVWLYLSKQATNP